ncbi:L-asparagine permease [Mycolicibacterium mageritense DSM 44476 = CIP 104973]|uniref:L-asparagine permease n=1 Tax=Mycolicibacterium mageritense TaxID=53462 RepID=A0ABN5Y3I7_MYCME|nr:amino acid permease [Mycolicibacterium mageritense]OKH82877.1 L-asparagine permease [Mycobacterium sp. SWH-M3]MCC9185661.1 amino acid permease [Mycolicibacterium mageritense]CDO23337.1 L-asparagine permease [Mycolicibacterium mageritense DSM 44476 = CIP 104973]BBX32115.1 L-asparagine permease [Mycolicibacterium mageritense]GJJ18693.1 L-asparagine permease [Mycolicibacterium mageritense]
MPPSSPQSEAVRPGVSHEQLTREDAGYHKGLKPRQLQMIAIGGAIGTGLFLGAGGRLASAGPGLFLVYAVCGVFVFLILRALGELVLHRPSSGSFVSYAREFYGEKAAYAVGWLYFLNWAMTAIVDTTAIATYFHYWKTFNVIPQWLLALMALGIVLGVNLISVKVFGEMEFWAALIKVVALMTFLVVGTIFLAGRYPVDGHSTGLSIIGQNGGLFPTGALPLLIVTSGVVFAYAAVELVGTAAGETAEPEKIMPRAINSVVARIAIFYVGSVVLLALLLPYTAYDKHESPFVTFFSKIGFDGAGDIMNVVVLTAAFSSLNAGLYSTGRILRSMAMNGSAPKFTARMSRNGVPYGGIVLTCVICLFGVVLNAFQPGEAFEIVLNMAALGIIASWGTIVLCQLRLVKMADAGIMKRPSFRMPLTPYSGYATLLFLFAVLVLMAFDAPIGTWTIGTLVVLVPALIGGWYLVRGRVMEAARERMGYTGEFPVVANRPVDPDE